MPRKRQQRTLQVAARTVQRQSRMSLCWASMPLAPLEPNRPWASLQQRGRTLAAPRSCRGGWAPNRSQRSIPVSLGRLAQQRPWPRVPARAYGFDAGPSCPASRLEGATCVAAAARIPACCPRLLSTTSHDKSSPPHPAAHTAAFPLQRRVAGLASSLARRVPR